MTNEREPHRNGQCATGDSTPESVGEAYAFLNYGGPKEKLSREVIENIRDRCQIPSALELGVFGDVGKKLSQSSELAVLAQGDPALGEIVRESDKTSFNYVIQGRRPGVTNEVVAFELNDLMNGIHSDLYAKDEPISCNIVYRLKGERNYDVLPD